MQKIQGWVENGNLTVAIAGTGYVSSTKVQGSFPGSTVTVYQAGTLSLASIYSDDGVSPTVKANPFTAGADGTWSFYAPNGIYDIKFSGGGIAIPFTLGGFSLGIAASGVPSYTLAGLPASKTQNAGNLARVTDAPGGLWMQSGIQWVKDGPLNIMDAPFNCRNDGATDDTTGFQAALDSGYDVYIPSGSGVLINSKRTLTTNGQTIFGEGRGQSSLLAGATPIELLYGTGLSSVTVRDLTLLGSHTGYLGTALSGIHLEDSNFSNIRNCQVSKFEIGVFLRSPTGNDSLSPEVVNNIIHDCYARGISFFGSPATNAALRGVKNLKCALNDVYNIGVGGVGFYAGAINTKECRGGTISGNTVHDGDGMRIENSDEIECANNTVSLIEKDGILVYNTAKRIVVIGNSIFTVNTVNNTNGVNDYTPALSNADLAGAGIEIQYESHDNIIEGNIVIDGVGGTGHMYYGIWVNPTNMPNDGTGPNQNMVVNNKVLNAITNAIEDRGYNTWTSNNRFGSSV